MLQKARSLNKKPVEWLVPLGSMLDGGYLYGLPVRERAFVKHWTLVISFE